MGLLTFDVFWRQHGGDLGRCARRAITPGCILALRVIRDSNHEERQMDQDWMNQYAEHAGAKGLDLGDAMMRLRAGFGELILVTECRWVMRLTHKQYVKFNKARDEPSKAMISELDPMWTDARMQEYRRERWRASKKSSFMTIIGFGHSEIVQPGCALSQHDVHGSKRVTPGLLLPAAVKRVNAVEFEKDVGNQEVCDQKNRLLFRLNQNTKKNRLLCGLRQCGAKF